MAARVDLRARLPRDLTWLVGVTLTFASAQFVAGNRLGVDAHAYWAASRGALYDGAPDTLDAYLYSPAFAQLVWLPARLPWPVFGVLWSLAAVASFVWLLRPLGWGWTIPLLLCCTPEFLTGNVFWVLALVAAYGVRPTGAWPALWAFPGSSQLGV